MDLKEIGISTRNWVDSAQDRDFWRALVNVALNLRAPYAKELVSPSLFLSIHTIPSDNIVNCFIFIFSCILIIYESTAFKMLSLLYSSKRIEGFLLKIYKYMYFLRWDINQIKYHIPLHFTSVPLYQWLENYSVVTSMYVQTPWIYNLGNVRNLIYNSKYGEESRRNPRVFMVIVSF